MDRVFNFSAGPAALPLEVLQQAQADKGFSLESKSEIGASVADNLRGKAVQVWLEQDQIMIAALD